MMGEALLMKHIIGNLSVKRLRQGYNTSYPIHCRRHFNSYTLVTRWSALILKVGHLYVKLIPLIIL